VQNFSASSFSSAFCYLGDFQLAEDAAQDAFTVAYSNLKPLQDPACFTGWFLGIVRHQCHRLFHARRAQEVASDNIGDPPASITAADTAYER